MQSIIRNQLQHEHHLVAVLDPALDFIAVNEAYAQADDKTPDFFVGKNHFALYPNEGNQKIFQNVLKSAQPHYESAKSFDYESAPKRGTSYWDWSLLPIKDEGDLVTGLLFTLEDVSDRVQAEQHQKALQGQLQQAQKLEAIGQLAGGIAHDFNNLLAVILGNADLARLELKHDHPVHEDLKEISLAAEQARDLTTRMLAFARRQTPQKRETQACRLVEDTASMLRRSLAKNIQLTLQHHKDSILSVDRNQIIQATLNICHNAADAMPEGGKLFVSCDVANFSNQACPRCNQPMLGDFCQILIRDTGHGIPHEHLDRIIEPFFTTKDIGSGTGLGLSATHGIVLSHGGHLHIESEPGEGTIVTILLPMMEALASKPEISITPVPSVRTLKVLVVDDEPQVLRMSCKMLEMDGHETAPAKNGEQALALFAAAPKNFDMVLLDMMMPDMDGLQVFAEMKKIHPEVKAILASGFCLDEQLEDILAQGLLSFVQKPFSYDQLMAAVAEALKE